MRASPWILAGVVAATSSTSVTIAPKARMAVPFLDDDYPKAVALARARHVPLFIEAWAPW